MRRAQNFFGEIILAHLDALTLRDRAFLLSPIQSSALLLAHLIGLAACFRFFNLPIWYALPALVLYGVLVFLLSRITHSPTHPLASLSLLAPFFLLYAILAARFIYVRVFNGRVPGYFDDVPPQPDAVIFQIEPIAVAVGLYLIALLLQKFFRARALNALAILFVMSTLAWASAEYFGQRARGVTASDPYAYVQMGIDLATRGTPLHQFILFPPNSQLPISWFPFVHVGYHLPNPQTGDAATVWSPGGSVAFAIAYRVWGEEGLYWVNPIFSLLALTATALLAREIFRDENPRQRAWIIALAIFLWATSSTVVAWAVVPMVDAQAAFFSALAIYFAFKTSHELRFTHYAIFSGVALALAYDIRHTQVLLAIPIAYLILSSEKSRRARWFALMAAGISALVALPDLIYHQTIFGSWLTPESEELGLFSFSDLGQTLSAFADRFFAAYEFGWLAPFLFYGAYRLARDKRREFIALFIFIFCLFTFHFFYPALRLRDLLPEFPAVIIMTAYGFVAWIEILLRGARARHKVAAAFAIFCALWLPTLRVWNTLRLPLQEPRALFGALNQNQRAAFEQLAQLTPPRAVIGSTLNSGAIDLYARRESFRPSDWNAREREIFLRALFAQNRAIFFLNDGTEIELVIAELQKNFSLRRVAKLDVPLFGAVNRDAGVLWEIIP